MGAAHYDVNFDGFAHFGLVPDMLQDVSNQLHGARHDALDTLFGRRGGVHRDVERSAQALALRRDRPMSRSHFERDPMCDGKPACRVTGAVRVARADGITALRSTKSTRSRTRAIREADHVPGHRIQWQQHRAKVLEAGDLSKQGDWAIVRLEEDQTWKCGGGRDRTSAAKRPRPT